MTPNSIYKNALFIVLVICAFCYFPTPLTGQSCGGSITLRSQAEIDNFTTTYGTCKSIGTLRLEGNDITNIDGLSNITSIGNFFAQQVPNLENFDGLANLKTVNNMLLNACRKVTNLDGFSSLTRINQELRLSRMTNLTSIEGLRNVTRMPRFRIFLNPKLATCCLLYRFANNPNTLVKVMYGNGGNCTVNRILAHPNTSTISLTEAVGTATSDMVCKGSTAEMKASGAFDFTWDADVSLSARDTSSPMITPTEETTYTVTARGCNNTVDTESFTVKISEPATTAIAGTEQIKLNETNFTLAANIPTVGAGEWSIDRGYAGTDVADLFDPTSNASLPINKSVALIWTITNGACVSSDEVILRSKSDIDEDGIPDNEDNCDDRIDTDGDSISDCKDTCDDRIDTDKDGISDCKDDCDDRIDSDGDGISDCKDPCDDRIDTDGDGIVDCFDPCDDSIDTDGDGTSDCQDRCPNDPTKIEPDACGCGEPDQTDSDGDGIINCMDDCPYDLNQYVDGQLACGITMKSDTRLGSRVIDNYGECSAIDFEGRELFYKLTLYDAGTVTVKFKEIGNGTNELQLFILNDYCFIDSCMGTIVGNPGTEESLVLEDLPAGDYYFAVDSRDFYHRAEFELTVDCGVGGSSWVTCPEDAITTEDFEGFNEGVDIVAASGNFELFGFSSVSANVATTTDGTTSNKAIYFDRSRGASDIVFVAPSQQNGIVRIAWNMFVKPNRGATFNIFGFESTANFGAKYQIGTEDTNLQGKWMSIEAYIDLDNDQYTMYINNRAIVVTGDYLMGFERLNFYAYWNNAFYVDNICYSMIEAVPTASKVAKVENNLLENIVKPTAAMTRYKRSEQGSLKIENSKLKIENLKVFPNPTTGSFTYQGQLSEMTSMTVEIFNQLGQSVRRVTVAEAQFIDLALDLNNLPEGIYLLQAYNDKVLDTQRIVLQR